MFLLDGVEVKVVVAVPPELGHLDDPAGVHGLDVGAFAGDVAVFGSVIFADYEMCHVGREVVLVDAAELGDALGDDGLGVSVCVQLAQG